MGRAWTRAATLVIVRVWARTRTRAVEDEPDAALALEYEEYRAQALAALAPQLTGELLARGLEAATAEG